jgi:thiosulfate/3-mercaptopyruvate sulfurtransferase
MFNLIRLRSPSAAILETVIGILSLYATAFADTDKQPLVRPDMLVSTDWLANQLDDPNVVVLHIAKERKHYEDGHIPGSRFVAWDEMTTTRGGVPNELPPIPELQKLFERLGVGDEARLVLYGDNFGLSAARAYFTLDYLGHGKRAALLDGGIEKWRADQQPISTESPEVQPARFTPQVNSNVVVGLEVVRDLSRVTSHTQNPKIILVDARPEEEYSGENKGDGIWRGGHIPGAANVYWMQNVVSKENPVLRSEAELRRLYEVAGATTDSKVVTYCRTGGQAAHAYFTAKYLGYDVAIYDGSFFEWSSAVDTPVTAGTKRK